MLGLLFQHVRLLKERCVNNAVQNLLPVKDSAAVDVAVPASSEQKLQQPNGSKSNISIESLATANGQRRQRHSCDENTQDSSPGSERGSRGGAQVAERTLRDRVVPATDHAEDHSTRESSPVSDRGSSRAGTQNTERSLRDRIAASVVGGVKERSRVVKRDASGTVSSSASTCSDDSELRINDFLGETLHH